MELENVVGEIAELNTQIATIDEDISKQVGYLLEKQRELSKAESELRKKLVECFENPEINVAGLTTVENEYIKATYRKPTTRRGIELDKLRANHPDIYAMYEKETAVKSSVVIKVKEVGDGEEN